MSSAPTHDRRGFLSRLSAGAAAFGAAFAAPGVAAAATAGRLAGDDRDAAEPWLRALRGKHRQLFHSYDKMDGTVLWQARAFIDLYQETYGVAPRQNSVVVAAHGTTGTMLMNDSIWSRYELGRMFKVDLLPEQAATPAAAPAAPATGAAAPAQPARVPATRNPYVKPREGDPADARTSVDALMGLGVTFLICNNALKQFAGVVARKDGISREAAHRVLLDNLVPGAVLVPAMIIAIGRAQEHGCSYLYSG